jgi:SMC interacting uncharacterized protein involved in chromosome segregation
MEKCLSDLKSGRDVLKEFDKLKEVAKVFDFCSDTAKAFVATKGNWPESLQELNTCVEEVSLIIGRTGRKKTQLRLLNEVKGRMRFEISQKYIDSKIEQFQEDELNSKDCFLFVVAICSIIVMFILIAISVQ